MSDSKNKITITFEGKPSEDGHVLLSEFVERLDSLRSLLRKIDLQISGENSPSVYYQITNLSHTSPATIEIEAKPMPKTFDRSVEVLDNFFNGLEHIRESQHVPDGYSYEILDAYKAFIDKPFKNLSDFNIQREERQPIAITDEIVYVIEKAVSGEFRNEGSMSGLLEAINIHDNTNKFTIYPLAGPNKVVCHFPNIKMQEAIDAINQHVCIQGSFKYRSKALLPHEVEVKEIEVLPPDEELPSLSSLRGMAPNAAGGKDSVVFVREIRDAADP